MGVINNYVSAIFTIYYFRIIKVKCFFFIVCRIFFAIRELLITRLLSRASPPSITQTVWSRSNYTEKGECICWILHPNNVIKWGRRVGYCRETKGRVISRGLLNSKRRHYETRPVAVGVIFSFVFDRDSGATYHLVFPESPRRKLIHSLACTGKIVLGRFSLWVFFFLKGTSFFRK